MRGALSLRLSSSIRMVLLLMVSGITRLSMSGCTSPSRLLRSCSGRWRCGLRVVISI